MLEFVAAHRWGVLATVKRDGRPQLSNVGYAYDRDADLVRVSVTADRAKTRNLARRPRVTLHVASKDFWTWVAVEGTAELTPVAADPRRRDGRGAGHRTTAAINGEHDELGRVPRRHGRRPPARRPVPARAHLRPAPLSG